MALAQLATLIQCSVLLQVSSCWRRAGVLHSQAACVVLAGPRRSEEILLQDEGCQLLVDVLLEVLNLLLLVVGCRILNTFFFRPLIGRLDSRGNRFD